MARKLLGMLTPSSNTVLEPVTTAMLAGLDDVTAHFGRFRVTEISLGDHALGQFTTSPMLDAARLLADAHVGTICWNGTSAGWLGLHADEDLSATISTETGIPACSSVLAIREIFERTGLRRYALVTPYTDDVQAAIMRTFSTEGYDCVGERHLGIHVNFDFSEVDQNTIAAMCREVAAERPEAIIIFCTNLQGAPIVAELERELGIPIYDTIATAVWASLRVVDVSPARVSGWGRLFEDLA